MRRVISLLATALLAATAADAGGRDAVQVCVERKTYPVVPPRRKQDATKVAAKLAGKTEYTTTLVVLENEYLQMHVLPELGGRLVRVVYKSFAPREDTRGSSTGEQLFWRLDELRDGVSWSMGGGRWSFPFWEHGRHFDETGGYAIVRDANSGAVTLAIDMRFDDYLTPAETGRYGRATNLRLVQLVTLRPGEACFTWTGRVDNPLPIRCGFKLWWLLRQPAVEGTQIILPAAAVTGHGATKLSAWDRDAECRTLNTSVFAVGVRHDFAGWYFPKRDLNVLRIQDHRVAPGAKQVIYPPREGGYIEMWGGNNEVFEECGRLLPAFGAYENKLTILPAKGIGRADYANEHAAVSCTRSDRGWEVKVVPTRRLAKAQLVLNRVEKFGPGQTPMALHNQTEPAAAGPDKPLALAQRDVSGRVGVQLYDGEQLLLSTSLPVDVGPMPEKEFAAVQGRTNGTMPGGKGLYAEATDLTSEHQLSLPRARKLIVDAVANAPATGDRINFTRLLMRLDSSSTAVAEAIDRVLTEDPDNARANLYKAIWLWEAGKTDDVEPLVKHLAKAKSLPGARYLLALLYVQRGGSENAVATLRALLAMPPAATFGGKDDPGTALMQPGCYAANTRPKLLLAILLAQKANKDEANKVLRKLLAGDPACIEAWMLLAERGDKEAREHVRTLTEHNDSGRRAAEKVLADLQAARWSGIGRP